MMSIALENNTNNRIERSGFVHGMTCIAIYDSTDSGRFSGDRRFRTDNTEEEATKDAVREREDMADSCSSSSIGRNSDGSGGSSDGGGDSGEVEVQSSYKGPLDTLDALEEVLPIKRGISTCYRGKSKSFTSLADVTSQSINDIAKPENAFTRKRKNLLAHANFSHSSKSSIGGVSKRLAVSMSSSERENNNESSNSNSSSPRVCRPPLPPNSRRFAANNESSSPSLSPPARDFSSWRSFSLSDLQNAGSTGSVSNNGDKGGNEH